MTNVDAIGEYRHLENLALSKKTPKDKTITGTNPNRKLPAAASKKKTHPPPPPEKENHPNNQPPPPPPPWDTPHYMPP